MFLREKIMYQFLNDKKYFVINVTKLWIFLQKDPSMILQIFTKMIPFSVLSNCMKINSKDDLINNYYSILILNDFQKKVTTVHVEHFSRSARDLTNNIGLRWPSNVVRVSLKVLVPRYGK